MKAPQPDTLQSEPVAYLWQHTITGQTKALMRDDVFTAGPHWRLVGPLFPAAESGQAVPVCDKNNAATSMSPT